MAALDPAQFAPCELLIGSPPCPTFSAAGGNAGGVVVAVIRGCLNALADGTDRRGEAREDAYALLLPVAHAQEAIRARRRGRPVDVGRVERRARRDAELSLLVVEPLRWALALRPRWIALEQVPGVLPLWEHTAALLRAAGWLTWTGLLSAECFGVPQTRERAFLLADRERQPKPPAATHQRFVPLPPEPGGEALFDAGPRQRIVYPGEEHLAPWVSMADALGWGMTERPTPTVTAGESRSGGADPLRGGSGAQAVIERERERERRLVLSPGRSESQPHRPLRSCSEPAPTVAFGNDAASWRWSAIGSREGKA